MNTFFENPSASPHSMQQNEAFLEDHKGVFCHNLNQRIATLIAGIDFTIEDLYGKPSDEDKKYLEDFKGRIKNTGSTTELMIQYACSTTEVNDEYKQALKNLETLSKEWPLAITTLKTEKMKTIRERINFAKKKFPNFLAEDNYFYFSTMEEKAEEAINTAKNEIRNSKSQESRGNAIEKALKSLQEIKDNVETKIDLYSMFNIKKKIQERINLVSKEFKDLNLVQFEEQVENIVKEGETQISNTKNNDEKRTFIRKTVNAMQDVDMFIEKQVAICEIQRRYNEILAMIQGSRNKGLSFSEEVNCAAENVANSKQQISNLHEFPFGMSPPLKLDVIIQGTFSALDRTLQEILIKIEHARIQQIIEQLPYSNKLGSLEGIGSDERKILERTKSAATSEAKEVATWGKDRRGKLVPPLLKKDQIEKNLEDYLVTASLQVYLAYAEQCIFKSLKFHTLRKKFEGLSEEHLVDIREKANDLIRIMKVKIKKTIEEAPEIKEDLLQNSCLMIQKSIDVIIDETIQELISYVPV